MADQTSGIDLMRRRMERASRRPPPPPRAAEGAVVAGAAPGGTGAREGAEATAPAPQEPAA
ncbi:MAG TPA: hypothetical protein VK951_11040, partial [Miltoncostaeaceae bacterium]|nr:hypothetical protein [Miltoncostaeaceae bacterium]